MTRKQSEQRDWMGKDPADIREPAQDANRDPLTGEAGSHPVGTGIGTALGAAAAGAAAGAVAGPIGTVAGAIIGGVAGGLAGKQVAEQIDPTVESAYWEKAYPSRPYYDREVAYDAYEPAYRYGWESRSRYADRDWHDVEDDLGRDWDGYRADQSNLSWDRARQATQDAWERVDQAVRSDPADNERLNKPR